MITIEEVEALAVTLETANAEARGKLLRLIRAEARILMARDPDKFPRCACYYGDEDGHFDGSYPPKQEYRDLTGPRLLAVRKARHDDIATEDGFYHDWRRVTEDPGLYVARDGRVWGRTDEGTGHFGQFAAHPGDCRVEVTISWDPRDESDLSLEDLRAVESALRALAFPLSSEAV